MKNILLTAMVLVCLFVHAQDHQQEINEQVWIPFTKAIITQNTAAFAALHAENLVRVERNTKKVFGLEQYRKNMEAGWPAWKESMEKNKIKYIFELRFTERICNGHLAYEVGYFKNESINPAGEKSISYGQFHVTLRKENGVWKILVDSDSNLGGTITEEMFLLAEPIKS